MSILDPYVGQILDEKYRLERLLGRGGMGAVYLATHLGTERYVALKLITPQFMRNAEFVERFKREARAAGRLRHPNVVDVTDFGFADAGGEPVAYLVMEYLDGCTLGDVLAEEERLPLEWVVDILEQVCSAVHEAHQQGIVHRDLKPDNIWLEPNRLGGFRVKVLDFGIAKLAEIEGGIGISDSPYASQSPGSPQTMGGGAGTGGLGSRSSNSELATLLYEEGEVGVTSHESGESNAAGAREANYTQPLIRTAQRTHVSSPAASTMVPLNEDAPANQTQTPRNVSMSGASESDDGDHTLLLDQATRRFDGAARTTMHAATSQGAELTRVGAIMGTPLYMSPEQCAAKHLDARSDVYSLGVIAYQMLAGQPPFTGDMPTVMRLHIEMAPPPLRDRVKKVPKRASGVVMTALAKDPVDRPQTAAAFANALRAEADSIGTLYRRAFALYSEYFPKFFRLSLIAHIPVLITTALLIVLKIAEDRMPKGGMPMKVTMISATVIVGLLQIASYFVASSVIAGMTAVIVTQLAVAPLRPVELRTAFAVLKYRWRAFLNTALRITVRLLIGFVLLVVPGIVISIRYMLYAPVVLMEGLEKKAARLRARELASRSWRTVIIIVLLQFFVPVAVSVLIGRFNITTTNNDGAIHLAKHSLPQQIYQHVSGLVNIFIIPLASIVSALLYLKMRQLGGESLSAALDQVEEMDVKRTEWQERMRTRLTVNTPRGSLNTPRSRG